ncbi:WecB/TagA/CpsF family glycosyltransferase [Butyrivibrio sp. XPD2006]|uniref:WecB/TagA/CpsF family glycosyltransferase n=1 Tax=Butyrivibrio sp. XPD2006 TaxID=1280668 RepID=UPI002E8E3976|nr:WecB/TagA/CpsF family glycosyltransferase [Butyrivibrio sp. XPD2006]
MSRAVMGMFFTFSIVLGYTLRMLYRRYHIGKYGDGSRPNTLMLHTPFPDEHGLDTMFQEGGFDDVMVLTRGASREEIEGVIGAAERLGIRTYCSLNALSYDVHSGIVTEVAHRASIPAFVRRDKFRLFGVNYSIARVEEAVLHVMRHLDELKGHYICFSNVHTTVMARESKEYAEVLNGAAFTFPDGTPIAKLQKKKGLIGADRVAGPDFMMHMFRDTTDGKITHFFYGSTQETLDALRAHLEIKYPGIVIKGMYSPPFRELTDEEDEADVEMINASGADIIWIGLGAPKQEKWMKAHEGKINGVMMGVGAGFDFHAGTIKRAPEWIQKIGFEWLYRLFQDPERLIKRYFVTNIKFLWYLAGEIMRNGL